MFSGSSRWDRVRPFSAPAFRHDRREAIHAEIAADRAWSEEMKARSPSQIREKPRQANTKAPQ